MPDFERGRVYWLTEMNMTCADVLGLCARVFSLPVFLNANNGRLESLAHNNISLPLVFGW